VVCRMLTAEFLSESGFSLEQYPDGKFWIKRYKGDDYFIQVSEDLKSISDYEVGWVEKLTESELVDIITGNKDY